jgi:hypothetical protein
VFIHTSCVTARRDLLLAVDGFNQDLPTSEDYDLWLRLALGHRFGCVRETLCRRRTHARSLSRSDLPANLVLKARMLEDFYLQYGTDRIPPSIARRRLAKVHYSAGKAMLKAGQFRQACQLLKHSLRYRPFQPKYRMLFVLSRAMALVRPSDCGVSEQDLAVQRRAGEAPP